MSLRPRLAIAATACCLASACRVSAAASPGPGDTWVVDTTVPATLQAISIDLPSSFTASGNFQYQIGFGTAETAATGSLFDSLTISLSKADGSQRANIVSADIFGLTLLPTEPGGLLEAGGVGVQQIPADATILGNSPTMFAYAIDVNLPASLVGQGLRTTFSFFNNGDAVPSIGQASVVPEPKTLSLVLGGFVLIVSALRRAKRA